MDDLDLLLPSEIKHRHKLKLAHEVEEDQCRLEKTEKRIWAGPCGKNMYRLEPSNILTYDVNLIPPTLIQGPKEKWVCFYRIEVQNTSPQNTVSEMPHLYGLHNIVLL